MTNAEIGLRYPRLIQALMWVACLSHGEAVACIRDHRQNFAYSSEAVNHFGGTKRCLQAAARQRVRHFMLECAIERHHQQALAHAQRERMNKTGRL